MRKAWYWLNTVETSFDDDGRTAPSFRLINESIITTFESKATIPNSTAALSEMEVPETRAIDPVRAETALQGLLEMRFCSINTLSSKRVLPMSST